MSNILISGTRYDNINTLKVKNADDQAQLVAFTLPKTAQEKTVSPTTSQQVVTPDEGKELTQVTVNAIQTETKTITPTKSSQTVTPQVNTYFSEVTVNAVTSSIDSNITANNIRQGVSILGVTGNLAADKPDQSKTVTPTTSQQTVTPDTGYELASVTVNAVTSSIDNNIKAENIKNGVVILGVNGTLTTETAVENISTASAMTALLVEGNVGKIYRFTGTTDSNYTNGDLYEVVGSTTPSPSVLPTEDEYFTYTQLEDGTYSIKGTKPALPAEAVIPSTFNDKSVTSIGGSAFYNCSKLTSITIPNSITSIGESAFNLCNGLTSITVPNSVTSIGSSAFSGCSGLTSAIISEEITRLSSSIFANCSRLANIKIPEKVTNIGDGAFASCSSLTSIAVPDKVTSISTFVFGGCSGLIDIVLPGSITNIGMSAFSNCSALKAVYFKGDASKWSNLLNGVSTNNANLTSATVYYYSEAMPASIGKYWHYAVDGVTPIVWTEFVPTADEYFNFYSDGQDGYVISVADVDNIPAEVVIPSTHEGKAVTAIEQAAFQDSTKLTGVVIPNSVTIIGEYAFDSCVGLTSVTIPDSVTSIDRGVFQYCPKLTNVTIPDSVTSIGDSAFEACSSLISITIGSSVTSIGNSAFNGCFKLIEVYNCSTLNITAGSSDNGGIGRYAKNVYTPTSGQSKLSNINGYIIYTNEAGKGLVGYSGNETQLVLPEGIIAIGGAAFYECGTLASILIPSSVTSIGEDAFYRCTALTSVYYKGTETEWNSITIDSKNNSSLTSATRYYYSETQPTTTGNYWHYAADGKTPVIW